MASAPRKVRLVRCPKCWGLLPELADHPVYKCGGCGATLKAKYRKEESQTVTPVANEDNPTQKNISHRASGSKEITSSSQEEIICPTEESKAMQENVMHDVDNMDNSGVEKIPQGFVSGVSSNEPNSYSQNSESLYKIEGNISKKEEILSPDGHLVSRESSSTIMEEASINVINEVEHEPDISSLIKQVEKFREIASSESDHIRHREPMEPFDHGSIIQEEDIVDEMMHNATLRRPPVHTNSNYYSAYDGSVSSYDGLDEEAMYQGYPYLPKRTSFKHQTARKVSPMLSSNRDQERYSRYIPEDNEPFYRRGGSSVTSYDDTGSGPSNFWPYKAFPSSSSLYPTDNLDYVERNQMELLQKVEELTDQINRTYIHSGQGSRNGRFSSTTSSHQGKQWPVYHESRAYSNHLNRHSVEYEYESRRPVSRHSGFSQMSLSGQTRNSSSYGYHDQAQYPLVPQRVHDTNTVYPIEKTRVTKRHYRPLAGGAPFINCKKCSKLLHLPADFLMSNRRCHKLRCGSCSEVLIFSLQDRIHIVPYKPKAPMLPYNYGRAGPVSISEDFGMSASQSRSIDREAAFLEPRKMQGKNSSRQIQREISMRRRGEAESKNGPSLHSLMGYPSATDMIKKTAI